MTDINDDSAATRALTPIPAREVPGYQEQVNFAQLMAKAQILPAHLHGNPGNCLAVITMAQNWNMNPIMVGLKTSVIPKKGGGETLMFEGQLVNAAINRSSYLQKRLSFDLSGEGANTTCVVRGLLKGESEERIVVVSMPQTQNSPLWKGNQGDKEQQLTYLATRVWARRHLPEILLGVYTPEDPWDERPDDSHNQRQDTVASRMAALDNMTQAPTGIPAEEKDDFIDNEAVTVSQEKPLPATVAEVAGRQITDNPENRQPDALDELLNGDIPAFDQAAGCKTCGGREIVEDETGKGPCPACQQS